jgi:hypothetical protein
MHAVTGGRQQVEDAVEARLTTYRGAFNSLLATVHTDLVGRVLHNRTARKEVEKAIRASLEDVRDREALKLWLGGVAGRDSARDRRPADAAAEALRVLCVADADEPAKREAARQLFEHLAGVALMPVNAATREFFYAGIFHRIVDSDYHRAIMDSVSVPITRGSVGHTFFSNTPLRLVPDSLKELRGTVAIEDVIGGNLSIAMCNLRTDGQEPTAGPPWYGVLFYFLPLPGFFGHLPRTGVTAKLLEDVGRAHESGLLYSLRWAESHEERDRIAQLLRSGPEASVAGVAAEASVPSHADLLRAIMPEQSEYDPLSAVAAVVFREDARGVTPLAVRGSRRFLERSLFQEALRSPLFHPFLERAVAAGDASSPSEPRLPPLACVEPHAEPAGAPASPDDPLSLWPGLVIAPAPDQGGGEGLAGFFVAHFTTGAVRGGSVPSLAHAQKERETVFVPLRWLEAVYQREWLECLSLVRGLPVEALARAGTREAFHRSVANLKLIADSGDSYVNLLAVTLARGYDGKRLTDYLAALFNLLDARLAGAESAVPPLLHKALDVVEAVCALREAILDAARAQGSLLLGVSGYRIGRDRAFISAVEPVEGGHAGVRRLADPGEHARVGRIVSLLRLWQDAGEDHSPGPVRLFQAVERRKRRRAAADRAAEGNEAAFLLSGLGCEGHTNGWDDAALLERLALRCCDPSSCAEDRTWSQDTELVDMVKGRVCARMRWDGGLLTIPVGLALDDSGLEHALDGAVRLNQAQAHGRGARDALSAAAAQTMLLEGDLPLAQAFRRLYPFGPSPSIRGFVVPTSRDDQREHFVFGCQPESRGSRAGLVEALENARRSLHAVDAATRAEVGLATVHHLGQFVMQLNGNIQLLGRKLSRFGTESYVHGHSTGLVRRLKDLVDRLIWFRDAANVSLGGPTKVGGRDRASISVGEALAVILRSTYVELAGNAPVMDASKNASGSTDFMALRVLASLAGCPYDEACRDGIPATLRRELEHRCAQFDFDEINEDRDFSIGEIAALYGRIGVHLEMSGTDTDIPVLLVNLALGEVVRNAITATAFAHWQRPKVAFSLEFRSSPGSLEIVNPLVPEDEKGFLQPRWGGGGWAADVLLKPFKIEVTKNIEPAIPDLNVKRASLSFHWGGP